MPSIDVTSRLKQAKKKIVGAIAAGGQINIGKASTGTVEAVSRSKVSKQRGEAKGELLKRAVSGTYR